MNRVEITTYTALIYIGGNVQKAKKAAQAFCNQVGLCVTVEEVAYVFTGGQCNGVRVGIINYGRFPQEPNLLLLRAEMLAKHLMDTLCQESASIVATDKTVWLSTPAAYGCDGK